MPSSSTAIASAYSGDERQRQSLVDGVCKVIFKRYSRAHLDKIGRSLAGRTRPRGGSLRLVRRIGQSVDADPRMASEVVVRGYGDHPRHRYRQRAQPNVDARLIPMAGEVGKAIQTRRRLRIPAEKPAHTPPASPAFVKAPDRTKRTYVATRAGRSAWRSTAVCVRSIATMSGKHHYH